MAISTVDPARSLTPLPGPVNRRLADSPTLASVAAELLRPTLEGLFSRGAAHVYSACQLTLGRERWRFENGHLTFFGYHLQRLTDAVIERYLLEAPVQVSAEGSFLSAEGGSEYPAHLTADMAVVNEAIDAVGPFIVQAWCEQLVKYWTQPSPAGESPLAWLARHLRDIVTKALNDSEAAQGLPAVDVTLIRATLGLAGGPVEPDQGQAQVMLAPGQALPAVLITSLEPAPRWIVYSAQAGFQRFASEEDAARYLGYPLAAPAPVAASDDLFENWSTAILNGYLVTRLLKATGLQRLKVDPYTFTSAMEAFLPGWVLDRAHHLERRGLLRRELPAWLSQASEADQVRYALGLQALLIARERLGDTGFLDDIPAVETFARRRLIDQAAADHPQAPLGDPDDVVVRIFTRKDDDLLSLAGGGGSVTLEERDISLIELSLLNTGGRPTGWMQVAPRPGKVLPAWLDDEGAIALVQAVNVGAAYLRLLHDSLASGVEGARHRETFRAQVASQLPLLALELKLRQESGFDETGVTLVRRTFVPDTTSPPPAVAQLALQAQAGLPADVVTAMFVLYQPDAADALVLYAPLARQPLRQFKNLAHLMSAILAEPGLERTVLTWLSDTAQARYRNGGLQAPRWLRFGQGDEFAPAVAVTPARLMPVRLWGDPLDAFYDGVVEAMTVAADRQTVSNEESGWISAREVGWLLFNQVLPFLRGSAATAGWLIQMSHSLDVHYNRVGASDAPEPISSSELIFDLILALVSEGASRVLAGGGTESGAPTAPVDPAAEVPLNFSLLDTRWGDPSMALTAQQALRLQALAVPRPVDLSPAAPSGPLQGLMQDEHRWLAWVQGAMYVVAPGDGEAVVLDPVSNEPVGPWLMRDEAGRWRLDLRLRLRGGGPKRRIEEQREINRQRRARANQCLVEIERIYRRARAAGEASEAAINRAIAASELAEVKGLRAAAGEAVEQAFEQCVQLRSEYHAISQEVAMPERGRDMSVALAAEINLCGYYLSLNREQLISGLAPMSAESPVPLSGQPMTEAQVQAWFAFLHEYVGLAQAGVRWRLRLDERLQALADIPVSGPDTLARLVPKFAAFRQLIEYRTLAVYVELSLIEEPLVKDEAIRRTVHDALKPLVVGLNTHKELTLEPSLGENSTTELLDGVIHTYQAAEDTVHWLKQTLAAEFVTPSMDRLLEAVAVLRQQAETWLGRLVREAAASRAAAQPGVAKPLGSRRMIRTRHRGPVIAKVRVLPERPNEEVAEVVSPLDSAVVTRFEHDASRGDWVEQLPSDSLAPVRRPAKVDVGRLADEADRLLDNAARQLQQAPRLARVTRIPVELEDLMKAAARDLDDLAEQIERTLTRLNETDLPVQVAGSAERKARALRDMAVRLTHEGHALRIRLTKTALPTAARVAYLVGEGEARVRRLGTRVQLKGQGKRKDIVQEYVVEERNGDPLWYAHFHYSSMEAAEGQYLAAHLKTASQRFIGLQAQLAQAVTDADVVKIYRSRIDPVAARALFLSSE